MRFYADLHIHSKYSRATSRTCDLEHLTLWAKRKGIRVVATGDFTHPAWWQEIQEKLVAAEPGLYRLRDDLEREVDAQLPVSCRRPVRFLLEVEISTIYKKGDKTRKVHHLIYAAHLETAGRFRDRLGSIGNIKSDGRPILGLDSRHLLEITLESGDDAYLVPAHIWTPWFSAMGSKSGFDSIADCYGDLSDHIFAVETGLSSDPPMNWRVSDLDRYTLVSNSDAHSPPMLGREACVFETEVDYFAIRRALETREGWGGTVEFFPEEGKYHLDGHRACGVRLEPEETRRSEGLCPKCGRPVTVGVLHRVEELADRPGGYEPDSPPAFNSLVPLPEIVSELQGTGPKSKAVQGRVAALTARLGPELEILESMPIEDVRRQSDPLMAEAVTRLREGRIRADGGFDGEYGVIRLFEVDEIVPQLTLAPLFGADFIEPPAPKPKLEESRPEKSRAEEPRTEKPSLEKASPPPQEEEAEMPLLDRLDADQRPAAEALGGAILILAGPGSGKTRTLTHRLAHMVESGIPAEHILALTFTRQAAAEMHERVLALLGGASTGLSVTTFHGLGHLLLRRHAAEAGLPTDFEIADDAARWGLVEQRFGVSRSAARRACEAWTLERRTGKKWEVETPEIDTPASLADYRSMLAAEGLVDLDDLVARPVELLDERPELAERLRARYRHVSVDEYQDVDPLQYRLLRHLAPPGFDSEVAAEGGSGAAGARSLCAIGDPDQSIYRFRGADVGFFLRFQRDYASGRVLELGRNYRSQRAVVEAAAAVIRPSSLVPGRRFEPVSSRSRPLELHTARSEAAEAEFVTHAIEEALGGTSYFSFDSGRVDDRGPGEDLSFEDIAILVRTKAQAAPFLEAFERAGLPVQHRTHRRLMEDDGVRLLVHELHLALESGQHPATGGGPGTRDALRSAIEAAPEGERAMLEAALELLEPLVARAGESPRAFLAALQTGAEVDAWDPRAERLSLLTLHAAKGLEFPVVFLAGCDDGLLPLTWPGGEVDVAEERRLFFVGMTRAKERLVLTRSARRAWRGEVREPGPSPFLSDLPRQLTRLRSHIGPGRRRAAAPRARQLSLLPPS
ncbi:MAG: UvrD-helicase domain-containing protein [Acidobacteriota bacterium]